MNNKLRKIILLQGDIIILYTALFLAISLRYLELPSIDAWKTHFIHFSLIFMVWLLIFYISDLYNLHIAINNNYFSSQTSKSLIVASFVAVAYFYANPNIAITPKTTLLIFIAVFAILFFLWRRFFNWSLRSYLPKNNIAFIGWNKKVAELVDFLIANPHLGFKPKLIISKEEEKDKRSLAWLKEFDNIKKELKKKQIKIVILTSDPHQSRTLRAALFKSLSLGMNFISFSNFYEKITGRIPLSSINQMWFLENLSEGNKQSFDSIKRLYDLCFALILLVISAPFWPVIAALIKLESKGPIFIKMERMGKNKKIFKMLKFRSMREENNKRTPTVKNDPRITRFGKIMRQTRIDEIPQIINIILGDMSLVGPRPELPKIVNQLEKEIPFYNERTLVKPGVTGWDQVSGEYHSPSLEDSLKKIQFDLFYIKNRSLYLDFSIILKTVKTVLGKVGI